MQKEDLQLNNPASSFLKRKGKCVFSRVGFTFSAGELDILAYNRWDRCFHICEGKRATRVASIGHAIGQLIAYYSMIQENGYDFLDRVSKEERLELSDFNIFFERRSIRICFYIVLPYEKKDVLLPSVNAILSNLGSFGKSIGVMFASKKRCELSILPTPVNVPILRVYNRDSFLSAVADSIEEHPLFHGLDVMAGPGKHYLRIKEKIGNPYLHYEVWFHKKLKSEKANKIEVGFHVEFAKAHLSQQVTQVRKRKLLKILGRSRSLLRKKGFDFSLDRKWGKQWSRLYIYYYAHERLSEEVFEQVIKALQVLIAVTKPKFDKINWGRLKHISD